jgi:hypothetical protein
MEKLQKRRRIGDSVDRKHAGCKQEEEKMPGTLTPEVGRGIVGKKLSTTRGSHP